MSSSVFITYSFEFTNETPVSTNIVAIYSSHPTAVSAICFMHTDYLNGYAWLEVHEYSKQYSF
jgi:hypothetical protein